MHLGIRVVLAQSFARIHRANLINFGILPLTFVNPEDLGRLSEGQTLTLSVLRERIQHPEPFPIFIGGEQKPIWVQHDLTERQAKIIRAGGLLNATKNKVL